MSKRQQSAETKYRNLRRDARIMAELLDLAAQRFEQIARRHQDPTTIIATSINADFKYTASDIRDLASECARVAFERGRGRGRKQS